MLRVLSLRRPTQTCVSLTTMDLHVRGLIVEFENYSIGRMRSPNTPIN